MIRKSELEVMKNWKGENNQPKVTVRCITYNQEKFIGKALDSFIMQETNFPFEIVVHDDASTDGTTEIIKQYEIQYPHIIKPIYEIENQHSKRNGAIGRIMKAYMRGGYVAVCEGDDFWCDNRKLQKQYEFMEAHRECSMCVHNSIVHDLGEIQKDRYFNDWREIHKLSEEEIFLEWKVHTSSFFYRNSFDFYPDFRIGVWNGDFACLTLAFYYGSVYCLPEVMSVYNANNPLGAVSKARNADGGYCKQQRIAQKLIAFLEDYNKYTNYKFNEIVRVRISEEVFRASEEKEKWLEAAREMSEKRYYYKVLKNKKLMTKIKTIWKYEGYRLKRFWVLTIRMRHARLKRKIESGKNVRT